MQYVPKMCLLRKITYGEFSEFVWEKKLHIDYILSFYARKKFITSETKRVKKYAKQHLKSKHLDCSSLLLSRWHDDLLK